MNPLQPPRPPAPVPQTAPLQQQQQVDLAAISISARIPLFWTDMPRMWFAQFEAIVGPQHQSENVKFDLVVSMLGKEELSQVADMIDDPPTEQRYGELKKRLLKVFQESAAAQFHKLVSEMDLGQQRPTQLLTRMKELAKNSGAAGETLKNLWMARLPSWVRAILANTSKGTGLDDLAEMADKIMDHLRSGEVAVLESPSATTSATALAATNYNGELIAAINNMSLEIKNLRGEVNEIRGRQAFRGSIGRSRSASRGPRRTPENKDWLCRYHFRFAENARRCESPCNWNPAKGN